MAEPVDAARWYCVSRDGMATLCAGEEDANVEAANAQQAFPRNGPYRAARLVDASGAEKLAAAERQRAADIVRHAASVHGLCCADCVALADLIEGLRPNV